MLILCLPKHVSSGKGYHIIRLILKPNLKFYCVAVAAMLMSNFLFAQERMPIKNNQLKISPVRIIDPANPGLEIGFERIYAGKFSTQISFGYMKDLLNVTPFDNYRGVRLSAEQKYFLHGTGKKHKYLSFEFALLNVRYSAEGSFIQDTALNTPVYQDTFKVHKQNYMFNLKYGYQIPLKRFVIDLSIGIGLKRRIAKRIDVLDVNAYEVEPRHPNLNYISNKEGNQLLFNVPMNIRLGYHF